MYTKYIKIKFYKAFRATEALIAETFPSLRNNSLKDCKLLHEGSLKKNNHFIFDIRQNSD